jgi:hypothetical protein
VHNLQEGVVMSCHYPSDDLRLALTQAARRVDLDPAAPHFETIARQQAIKMEKARLINVELRKERDLAYAERDAAYDLAAQYATRAGVDFTHDKALVYVAAYWEQRGRFERTWKALEHARWDTLAVAWELRELAMGKRWTDLDMLSFAAAVSDELTAINSAQGGRKRTVDLFKRPEAPGVAA